MWVFGVEYDQKVDQGEDTAVFLATMTAEIFSGTGVLASRQQLVDIVGAVVRLESMEWNLHTAYDPTEVVEIGISLWVPLVLLLALLLPAVAWGVVRCRNRGNKSIFLPVEPAEWSACAARDLDNKGKGYVGSDPPLIGAEPLDEYYNQVYAFGPVAMIDGEASQHLGWVSRQAVVKQGAPSADERPHRRASVA